MSYIAPIKDMQFVLDELVGIEALRRLPGCEEASAETVTAVLEEGARFVGEVLAPLDRGGDIHGATWKDGKVATAPGFQAAYKAFTEGGWQGLQHPTEFGGQGLPKVIAAACSEMLQASNLSFALCPMLTDGAIEALLTAGSEEQQARLLPKLIDGRWTGTMNLTEPQAGSDLSLVRSRAVKQADGGYRISGQKIFITYGEHDLAENIVHLVLARTPDAPEGVKGISLFIVPKFLARPDGSPGQRNDVWCASIEHKLGIKASPTAVLLFGDDKGEVGAGALGELIGEENRGLEYMFIMMNAARFHVGVQGLGVAERAYQKAVEYARLRVQSRAVEGSPGPVTIIHHPDVRRMLMSMRAQTEAARALAYVAAGLLDRSHHSPEAADRKLAQAQYEYLVPVVKGWCTELALDVASTGVQVHGGMGFIEETGAAQHFRDARILTIYEGTTAIQANDFIGRKTARDGGAVARGFIVSMRETAGTLADAKDPDLQAIGVRLQAAAAAFEGSVNFVVSQAKADPRINAAGSVPFLMQAGLTLGGWQMARAAAAARQHLDAGHSDHAFLGAKIATARFFAEHLLVRCEGLAAEIARGAGSVLALGEEQF